MSVNLSVPLGRSGAQDSIVVYKAFLPTVLDRMERALQVQTLSAEDKEHNESLIAQFCGIAQMIFLRLLPSNGAVQADRAMMALLTIVQIPNATCLEDAFLVMPAIASCLDAEFSVSVSLLLSCVCDLYLYALSLTLYSASPVFCCRNTSSMSFRALSKACAAIKPKSCAPFRWVLWWISAPPSDRICSRIATRSWKRSRRLWQARMSRDIKPAVIACFGDIAMAIAGAYEPYLQVSAMMLMQASQQCMTCPEDEKLLFFINNLSLSILEAYSGIIIGLSDGNKVPLFMANVPPMFQFLQYLSTPASEKDDRVLAKAMALVGDIYKQMLPHNPAIRNKFLNQP